MLPFASSADEAASFTLDPTELARQRAASARCLHATQIPLARAIGFAILCVMALLQDVRAGALAESRGVFVLIAANLGYATASWLILMDNESQLAAAVQRWA